MVCHDVWGEQVQLAATHGVARTRERENEKEREREGEERKEKENGRARQVGLGRLVGPIRV